MAELQTLSNKRRARGLLGSPRDELRLRIHGPRRDGQVVVVRIPKCTVGSADSCHLPLLGPGIQPVHCLVLRGRRGAVVRCLAPGTTLNGMQIQDASLFAGDRLRIGPFELEVLPTVATIQDRKTPAPAEPPAEPAAAASHAPIAGHGVDRVSPPVEDSPSLGELATTIESRINRIEGQLAELRQQDGGRAEACESKIQEIKLAQQAITSLSRQLDCERERHDTALAALVAERDRLAGELADATQTAGDLCGELDRVRRAHLETDATNESHLRRIAEVSAEVDRLAQRLTETNRQHQEARDQWQAHKDDLEQRLTDGVNRLARLEQEFDVVRRDHEDAAAQRHLQGSQSEELRESVRALEEQLAAQQQHQADSQAAWLNERRELEDKFQQLEELHRQATAPTKAESVPGTSAECAAEATPETPAEITAPAEITPRPARQRLLSVADLDDDRPLPPDPWQAPLHLEAETPDEEQHQTLVSRLDQLKASRVAAQRQAQADHPGEFRPYEAFNDLESRMWQASPSAAASDDSADTAPPANFGRADGVSGDVHDDPHDDTIGDVPPQPAVSARDQLFDRLNAPQSDHPAEAADGCASPVPDGETPGAPPASQAITGGAPDELSGTGLPAAAGDEDDASPIKAAPVTAAEVLARMGQLENFVEEEPDSGCGGSSIATGDTGPASDATTEIGDDDESIEAYMNQLLARVRGGDSTVQASRPRTSPAVEKPWQPKLEAKDVNKTESAGETAGETVGEPTEYVPRSQAPEQNLNLSAMRELANDTARSAIQTHAKKSGGDLALAKMIAAAAGIAVAGVSSFYSEQHPILSYLGVGGGLGAAAFWAWQAFFLKRNAEVAVRKVTTATIGAAHQAAAAVEEPTPTKDRE